MKKLDDNAILQIHDEQVNLYGGQLGIRDLNLFQSECSMPYQTFYGQDLFPDLYDKAVRYLFGFATNQVFLDGNKRTAAMVTLVFLALNDVELDITDLDLYDLCMQVANKQVEESTVKEYLVFHTI
ncbi:MAG: type II toxin-antitoxin system death-on-curing family toxin [Lachnospiraceae bacterium]|nr:type II toxin-antitoxin system death-on-curing family toxin [Lachnospiraceae bacterium]